jgi:hypothetical protein
LYLKSLGNWFETEVERRRSKEWILGRPGRLAGTEGVIERDERFFDEGLGTYSQFAVEEAIVPGRYATDQDMAVPLQAACPIMSSAD